MEKPRLSLGKLRPARGGRCPEKRPSEKPRLLEGKPRPYPEVLFPEDASSEKPRPSKKPRLLGGRACSP